MQCLTKERQDPGESNESYKEKIAKLEIVIATAEEACSGSATRKVQEENETLQLEKSKKRMKSCSS
jgi:hypothetical protein